MTASGNMATTSTSWIPEAHTYLPDGFALLRREVPDLNAGEYRISFSASTTVMISKEGELRRDYRDEVLRDTLDQLAYFIDTRIKEIAA